MRKVDVNPSGFGKTYMDKNLTDDKLYEKVNQFSERKITPVKFYSLFLNEIRSSFNGNCRTFKMLFANDDKIIRLIDGTEN